MFTRHRIELVRRLDRLFVARIIDYDPEEPHAKMACVFISGACKMVRDCVEQAKQYAIENNWIVEVDNHIDVFRTKSPNPDQDSIYTRPSYRVVKNHALSNRRGGLHDV